VLLTGPARGYVRLELERRGVPFVHRLLPTRDDLTTAYHALDAYVVASRQEGGPKSILESMAAGVPLVTTRAGQAPDLVVDGENGILTEVGDHAALAAGLVQIHADVAFASRLREAGRRTAMENSHERLALRWEALLEGFAERPGG
jgi:glycosyltransferase involved in cell wall biosynthesis